jgi:hypothetical protein
MSRNADFAILEDDQQWMYQAATEHEVMCSASTDHRCSALYECETKEEIDARRAALGRHEF